MEVLGSGNALRWFLPKSFKFPKSLTIRGLRRPGPRKSLIRKDLRLSLKNFANRLTFELNGCMFRYD